MEVRHGGVGYLRGGLPGGLPESGGPPLDFSVNVSPIGPPPAAVAAVRRRAADGGKYPDPFCREHRDALASCLGLDADRIVCGNGAGDLIYRIVYRKSPRGALVTAPAFSDYEKALREVSCNMVYHEISKNDFLLDEQILSKINRSVQIVFLCNPNNPTGLTIDRNLLELIVRKCNAHGVTLVIDECFNEFLDEAGTHSALPFAYEFQNVIILRAFTKIYAMAGLRLGYCVTGSVKDADAIVETGQAWPVSVIAQSAGIAALQDKDYIKNVRALIGEERTRMKYEFERLGVEVLGGEANFIFFRIGPGSGFDKKTFFDSLLRRNILIRCCGNYRSLDDSYYRSAVLTHDENTLLLQAMSEIRNL
ncbi:MAG: aminotransferase class I/II-fold pyridoxal phosphate-dependent enzyme [Spirochaetaceae bacterium]|jgi:threonine-phosphate decarboxylase|nr:aminotransferase class I/II-fold pyridoxal phosphate-dependent enzyme [Spirochaetaceae bacterium]